MDVTDSLRDGFFFSHEGAKKRLIHARRGDAERRLAPDQVRRDEQR
jgi:hypothetical protein